MSLGDMPWTGPVFWTKPDPEPEAHWAYPLGWAERVKADRRRERIMALGAVLYCDQMTAVLLRMAQTNVVATRVRVPNVELVSPWPIH